MLYISLMSSIGIIFRSLYIKYCCLTIDDHANLPRVMAKLFTNHDPFHIHKTLGLLALLDYLLRLYYLFRYGSAFPSHEPLGRALFCVSIHGILSVSSLLLPIPSKRNFSSPMIWPEFRLHSITFAMRHVIATILTLLDAWPSGIFFEAGLKLSLVIFTIECASWITEMFGDRIKRTTNTMPYPSWITENMQEGVKDMYSRAQFGATKVVMLADPTLSFFPLLGIQMAPFLMTLVRKGKINAIHYHRIYAISLFTSYVATVVRLYTQPDKILIVSMLINGGLFSLIYLRKHGIRPRMIWVFYTIFQFAVIPSLLSLFGFSSVVIASTVAAVISSGYESGEKSPQCQVLGILLAMLGMTLKLAAFGTDFKFEEEYSEPVILKLAPLIVLPPIFKQISAYCCLFIDKKKLCDKKVTTDDKFSKPVNENTETFLSESSGARQSKFLSS